MSPLFANIAFFSVSILLIATAYKWTGINPHRVEDGPSWISALWSGIQTSIILFIAVALIGGSHDKTASFLYHYACGSVIAPAFWTSFSTSSEEEPSIIIRWWKSKLNNIGDGLFKSMFTLPLAFIIGFFIKEDPLFWATIMLATALSVGKIGNTLLLIEADADSNLLAKRRNILILKNVIATAILGTAAMLCWAWLAHAMVENFPPLRLTDYITVFGFLMGVLFHTL